MKTSPHRWALDIVVRVLDWCPARRRWVDVERPRYIAADPDKRER